MLSFVIVLKNQDVIIYHMHYKQCGPSPSRGLFQGAAPPALLCHKETARCIQRHLLGTFCFSSLFLYGIRLPIIGPFRALKPTILMP